MGVGPPRGGPSQKKPSGFGNLGAEFEGNCMFLYLDVVVQFCSRMAIQPSSCETILNT